MLYSEQYAKKHKRKRHLAFAREEEVGNAL